MTNDKFEKMALVDHHRLEKGKQVLSTVTSAVDELNQEHKKLDERMMDMDESLAEANSLLTSLEKRNIRQDLPLCDTSDLFISEETLFVPKRERSFELLDVIAFDEKDDFEALLSRHMTYAHNHRIDLDKKLSSLLSRDDVEKLNKMIDEDFTYKNANCDKYDYMIAGTVGVLGAIIDIFFVGAPGEGILTKASDSAVNSAVEKFASFCGWKGAREGKDPTKSAIGFLERNFRVNYDHRHGADVGKAFEMSPINHHIKNLAHSPDLIGLFFSILDQFTNTAHFVDNGKLISISTKDKDFELSGGNFIAKIFSGFANWLGHLFSDVAGSSGAGGRGSGIPIPFFNLLQLLNFGEFGQHRQSFSTVCVQVFEKGYDFRHGLALSIPVLTTELLIRMMFFVKQHFYHKKSIPDSLPNASNHELRRMLLVGHGTLCIFDVGDAALRSGGDMIKFLLRSNLIEWVRFSSLAMKELAVFVKQGHIDEELLDSYIEQEYRKILNR